MSSSFKLRGPDDFGVSVSLQVPCQLLVLLRFLPLPVSVLNIIVLLVSDPFFFKFEIFTGMVLHLLFSYNTRLER